MRMVSAGTEILITTSLTPQVRLRPFLRGIYAVWGNYGLFH